MNAAVTQTVTVSQARCGHWHEGLDFPRFPTRVTVRWFAKGGEKEKEKRHLTELAADGCLQLDWPQAAYGLVLWLPLVASLSSPRDRHDLNNKDGAESLGDGVRDQTGMSTNCQNIVKSWRQLQKNKNQHNLKWSPGRHVSASNLR